MGWGRGFGWLFAASGGELALARRLVEAKASSSSEWVASSCSMARDGGWGLMAAASGVWPGLAEGLLMRPSGRELIREGVVVCLGRAQGTLRPWLALALNGEEFGSSPDWREA